jgi:hypothetical protein
MLRVRRPAALALSVAVLGVTGCGGSDAPPPAAAPAPAAPAAGVAPSSSSATPVSADGSGAISMDIESERKAAKKSLRAWGKAADRACRKAERRVDLWEPRFASAGPKGRKPTKADAQRVGRLIARFARAAEYEYKLLTAIAMPKEADAIDAIDSFLQKEEEMLMLIQRLGAELTVANDRDSIISALRRLDRLEDDYKRAARAAGAPVCQ